jgi:hypothetical protein
MHRARKGFKKTRDEMHGTSKKTRQDPFDICLIRISVADVSFKFLARGTVERALMPRS